MASVKVYQYDYFDGLLKRERRSVDYATSDAIAAMHGTILAETVREIDEDLLDERGFIRAMDMPIRELPELRPTVVAVKTGTQAGSPPTRG